MTPIKLSRFISPPPETAAPSLPTSLPSPTLYWSTKRPATATNAVDRWRHRQCTVYQQHWQQRFTHHAPASTNTERSIYSPKSQSLTSSSSSPSSPQWHMRHAQRSRDPCGRLSWLPVSFLLHVKYTLSYPSVTIVYIAVRWNPSFSDFDNAVVDEAARWCSPVTKLERGGRGF